MKASLPKVKKRVNAFLLGEEGKISKESLFKIGAFVSGAAVASSLMAKSASAGWSHDNQLTLNPPTEGTPKTVFKHAHSTSHSSY